MPSFTGGGIGVTWGFVLHEDGWDDSYNLNFQLLDAVIQLNVISFLDTPPGTPAAEDRYIVEATATGAWVGQEGKIAVWTKKEDADSRAWVFIAPDEGWVAYNKDTGTDWRYDGAAWVEFSSALPAVGTEGQVLTVVAGAPAWDDPTGGAGFDLTEGAVWQGDAAYTKGTFVTYDGKRYIASVDIAIPSGTPGLDGSIFADGAGATLNVNGLDTTGTADTIVLVAAWNHDGTTVSTITSTSGLEFVQRASQTRTNISGHRLRVEVWTAPVSEALTNEDFTITLSNANPSDSKAVVFGVFGGDISDPLDAHADSIKTASGDRTAPGVTGFSTSTADDLLIFVAASDSDGSSGLVANAAPATWTLLNYQGNPTNDNNPNVVNLAVSTKLVTTTQSAISISDGGDPSVWGAIAIAVKADGAANLNPAGDPQWIVVDEGAASSDLDTLIGSSPGTLAVRGSSVWEALTPGDEDDVLTIVGGVPDWAVNAGGGGGGGGGLFSQIITGTPTSAGTGLSTWRNQGGASVANGATGVVLTVPAGAGDNLRIREKTAPATPYVITALLAVEATNQQFQSAGIGWNDGTKLHTIHLTQAGLIEVGKWNTISSFSAADVSQSRIQQTNPVWFQIEDDGTNVYFRTSSDGVTFRTVFSVAKASGWLGGSGYTNVCFFGNRQNSSGTSTLYATLMHYDE